MRKSLPLTSLFRKLLAWSSGETILLTHWPVLLAAGLLICLCLIGLLSGQLKAQDTTTATSEPDKLGNSRMNVPVLHAAQNHPDIIGGQEAAPGAWPWAAAIVIAGEPNAHDGQYCSGSLIQAQWVLTAAHCSFDSNDNPLLPSIFDVILGRHQLSASNGERIHVVQIIRHPQYNPHGTDWDVALFKLATPSTALPIALIDPGKLALAAPGTLSTVIGWGVTDATATAGSDVLRQVALPLVSYRSCTYSYGIFRNVISPQMLCAGFVEPGKSACYGDSGGPLMSFDNQANQWVQVGVVNWGPQDCAVRYYYNVYARLSEFVTWIAAQIPEVATPTPTSPPTATPTATSTPTPTTTFTVTVAPTAPTATPVPTGSIAYLPWIAHQPTPAPTRLLQNGNFEAGANVGWTERTLNASSLVLKKNTLGLTPHAGNYAARLGNVLNEVSVLEQDVTVPVGSGVLHYWIQIRSTDSCGFDFGGVVVNDQVLDRIYLCQETVTKAWQQRTVDLTAYAGQTVNLQFRAESDGTLASTLYVDDISFAATQEQ